MITLLIDGDPIARNAALYANTREDAVRSAEAQVRKLMRKLGADRAIVALSDPSRKYFRHELWPAYKAKRKPAPENLADAYDGFRGIPKVNVRALPGMEAEDVIGILATHPKVAGDKIIVGEDHDLLTIPGTHYRIRKEKTVEICADQADCYHLLQALTGDSGDGYPGCPGLGPKKAQAVVGLLAYRHSPAGAWAAVVDAYVARGFTADDALLQARVARICRATEYDLDNRRVILWNPPMHRSSDDPSEVVGGPGVLVGGLPGDGRGSEAVGRRDRTPADARVLDQEQSGRRNPLPAAPDHEGAAAHGPAAAKVVPASLFAGDGPAEGWPS